jgi:mono/diheme cytochrome c family protein
MADNLLSEDAAVRADQDQIENKQAKGQDYLLEVDNPLVLPTGKKVRVLLTSADVIHNWWVPQFGSARDAIPGFLRETWVQVDEAGTFRGACKELCGKGHGFMPVVVDAVPEAEFKTWASDQKVKMAAAAAGADKEWTKDDLVAKGKEVYTKNCAVCHQANGQGLPPAFPALTGSKIVNGPNLNLLGTREPEVYGKQSFEEFFEELTHGFNGELSYFQSNIEGELIDFLQQFLFSLFGKFANIIKTYFLV